MNNQPLHRSYAFEQFLFFMHPRANRFKYRTAFRSLPQVEFRKPTRRRSFAADTVNGSLRRMVSPRIPMCCVTCTKTCDMHENSMFMAYSHYSTLRFSRQRAIVPYRSGARIPGLACHISRFWRNTEMRGSLSWVRTALTGFNKSASESSLKLEISLETEYNYFTENAYLLEVSCPGLFI